MKKTRFSEEQIAFQQRPHQRPHVLGGWFGERHIQFGDFRGLPERYASIALMPQWEFLDFLGVQARTPSSRRRRLRHRRRRRPGDR